MLLAFAHARLLKRSLLDLASRLPPYVTNTARTRQYNCLGGEALHLFENAVVAAQGNAANVRQADINAGILALKKRVFPANASKWEKKYLTHCAYKPADMRIAQFKDELWAINRKIANFPPTDRPRGSQACAVILLAFSVVKSKSFLLCG